MIFSFILINSSIFHPGRRDTIDNNNFLHGFFEGIHTFQMFRHDKQIHTLYIFNSFIILIFASSKSCKSYLTHI